MNQKELYDILLLHNNLYPKMEPIDVIKLLYQNEFGGGHLIKDSASSLSYLKKEYENTTKDKDSLLFVDIGNNIIRVNLSAIDFYNISVEKLNELFVSSSNETKGSIDSFKEKIEYVKRLAKDNFFNFSYDDFSLLLKKYEKANYPMVSHSDTYRKLYKPAYRIILKNKLVIN